MNRHQAFFGVALLVSLAAGAQPQFERMERRNLWNDGGNAAGIRMDRSEMSAAGIGGLYEWGGFRNMSQSESQWSVGAGARSIRHFERFSLKGSFDFANTEAAGMCGSMFMDSRFFPIDVMEFTPGRKTFQSYAMTGAISVDLSDRWKAGLGLDYNARNAAKRKDLRYSAYRMDMRFMPSALYTGGTYSLGANLVLARNTETVTAEQTGWATTAPFAFFDEGLGFGNWQTWTGNGSRLKESGVTGLPVRQDIWGAQLQYVRGAVYAHATALWKSGTVGERQTVWYRYSGPQVEGRLSAGIGQHTLRSSLEWKRLDNRETVQDKVTEGGVALVREYASNSILKTNSLTAALDYVCETRDWDAGLNVTFTDLQRLSTPMYPFVYSRDLKTFCATASAVYRLGRYEFGMAAGYRTGTGNDVERTVAAAGGVTVPFRKSDVYTDACLFETCSRFMLGAYADWQFMEHVHAALRYDGTLAPDFYDDTCVRNTFNLSITYIY